MDAVLVYKYYLGNTYRIGDVIKSPFPSNVRKPDSKPSFTTKRYGDRIVWKDFAIDSMEGYGPIGFVCLMEGLSRDNAVKYIYDVILKNKPRNKSKSIEDQFEYISSIKTPLVFEYQMPGPEHYQYYSRLSVHPNLLYLYKIFALTKIIKDDNPFWNAKLGCIGFYKRIGKGNKAYMPFNSNYYPRLSKVIHQGIDILEGYDELPPFGKLLIITKSLKDVIFLRQAGYFAVATSGETSFNILSLYAWELSERFEDVVAWGDPDKAGYIFSQNVKKLIPKARIAISQIAKDPTDIFIITNNYFYINNIILKAS